MNKSFRKSQGIKPTIIDLVADTIEHECAKRMSPPLKIGRMAAEALAFVTVRRLRKEDRKRGYVRVKKRDWLLAGIP